MKKGIQKYIFLLLISTLQLTSPNPLDPPKIFDQDFLVTAFQTIGKTPSQVENISVVISFQPKLALDNELAFCNSISKEISNDVVKSSFETVQHLERVVREKESNLDEVKTDLNFFLLDSIDTEESHHRFVKLEILEPQGIVKVVKSENIVKMNFGLTENNLEKDLSYVKEQLDKNQTLGLEKLLNSRMDSALPMRLGCKKNGDRIKENRNS